MLSRGLSLWFFAFTVFISSPVWAQLSYDGSSTIGENLLPDLAQAFQEKTGITFQHIGLAGSGKGLKAMLDDKVLIAGVSRPLTAQEKAKKIYYWWLAYDAIAVYVNSGNSVSNLSKEQLQKIFTRKITNWQDVGGPDARIEVVTEILTGGRATNLEFQDMALDGQAFGKSTEVDKPIDCAKYVIDHPYAIAFATINFKMPGIKWIAIDNIEPKGAEIRLGNYLMVRPLLLVTKKIPDGDLRKFLDFTASPAGQKIVAKYFVPIE